MYVDYRNYAYITQKSTLVAILDLYLEIQRDISEDKTVRILLTDFSSAFESIQKVC